MKANLFIAGACKSGTTFLHDFLSEQEFILGADPKEPYFFELPEKSRNEDDYQKKYFETYENQKYLLDSRHRNMFFSWIPKAIHDYNAESKLIFVLRNPIDRAFSHWWMWYSRGIIKTSFVKTIKNEMKSIAQNGSFMDISPEDYEVFVREKSYQQRLAYADANTVVESGHYYEQLMRFLKYFDRDNMLILDFEMISNMSELNPVLSDFLKIEISNIDHVTRQNKARDHKKAKHFLAPYVPKSVKSTLKNLFFKKPKISQKSYRLLHDHFYDHNQNLVDKFGLDFVKKWQKR